MTRSMMYDKAKVEMRNAMMSRYHRLSSQAIKMRQQGNKAARSRQFIRARDLWNEAGVLHNKAIAAHKEATAIQQELDMEEQS